MRKTRLLLALIAASYCPAADKKLRLPDWFTLFEPQHQGIDEQTADAVRMSFDSDASFGSVVGYYEGALRKSASAGVSFSEGSTGHGTAFMVSSRYTSCRLDIGNQAKPHVEIQCSATHEREQRAASESPSSRLPDIRRVNWGMTKAQVLATEPKATVNSPSLLGLVDTVDGRSVLIGYQLIENKLARVLYTSLEKYPDPSQYVIETLSIQQALAEKYGAPQQAGARWLNDTFRADPPHWGTALYLGQVIFSQTWVTDRTRIQQISAGVSNGPLGRVSVQVVYTGLEFEAAIAQQQADERRKAY